MVREVKKGFKIVKIGNSQGVIIDKNTLEYLDVSVGNWIELVIKKAENEKEDQKDK